LPFDQHAQAVELPGRGEVARDPDRQKPRPAVELNLLAATVATVAASLTAGTTASPGIVQATAPSLR
jgi:hypothetical protein